MGWVRAPAPPMAFNSFEYGLFLWSVYVLFWTLAKQRSLRHSFLLVASYWFYAQADWRFLSLLAISSVVDYAAGLGVERCREAGDRRGAKRWLTLSLVANLGMLGWFKYFGFFADETAALLTRLGFAANTPVLEIALPVGISFYTFQTLSYTLDIYAGRMKPIRSLLDFSLYVSFFPQLVAGPIVRARDFLPQLERPPQFQSSQLASGLFQILRGLAKKLLIADVLGLHLVDQAFRDADSMGELGALGLLLATYGYALQLYGDFAGYSDIAIGSARCLGFELPKNFDAPFKAKSLEDFWSRWHISMSSWFMDYVYIQMGGSRGSWWKASRNVLVAWGLVGLWHGAAWTFVLWGLYHGAWLIVVRAFRKLLPGGAFPDRFPFRLAGGIFTFHVVAFSMVLFRCPDMETFWTACRQITDWSRPLPELPWQIWAVIVVGYVTHLWPGDLAESLERRFVACPAVLQGALFAAALVLFFFLAPPGTAPFIYFQF